MPTYLRLPRFNRDWDRLTPEQQRRFRAALIVFVEDLRKGDGFRPGLRVKTMSGHDIWELSWAPDGRATFMYGAPVRGGEPHVAWRRTGTHNIFVEP
jgi:hypothetical protein